MFQFPSNGKARGNRIHWKYLWRRVWVSIPFKREGTWKPSFVVDYRCWWFTLCFNSLQTGRHVETDESVINYSHEDRFHSLQTGRHVETFRATVTEDLELGFQFPSNGKARGNHNSGETKRNGFGVSIPFKREGTWKPTNPEMRQRYLDQVSIPFKREGTCELLPVPGVWLYALSFNSLQTGRHV